MTPKILRALRALMPAAALAALVLLSSAALAQDKKVRMQMAGAYPSAMPSLGQGQLYTADRIRKLSAGSVEMRFFEAGALVPARNTSMRSGTEPSIRPGPVSAS